MQSKDKAEREVIAEASELKPTKSTTIEKKIKALNKKLLAIEELQRKVTEEEYELDEQQQKKVDSLGATLEELEDFVEGRRQ